MPISYKNKIYTTLGTPTDLSGDVVSAADSSGVPAKDYTVKGKSIVWNQLLDKSKYPATTTTNGVTFTNNGDGTITVNGTATANVIFAPIGQNNPISIVSGHKFLFISCPPGGSQNTYFSDLKNVPEDESFFDVGGGVIMATASTTTGLRCNIRVISGYTANNLIFKPQLFDLTQMFGAGNEPATVEEFRAMFPDDYYPYNDGELKSIVPTSVEASGVERFQLLDKSKYPATTTTNGVTFTNNGDGTIIVNGTATANTIFALIVGSNSIPVISGHKFLFISCPLGGSSSTYYSDLKTVPGDKGFIDMGAGLIMTTSAATTALRCNIRVFSGYTANNLIFKPQLFNLTEMFGVGNEPATVAEFWQRVPETLYGYNPDDYKSANIPSSKYFPDGMKSAGSVYDEINFLSQKAIKRVGAVDMGTLNWEYVDHYTNPAFVVKFTDAKGNDTGKARVLCDLYESYYGDYTRMPDMKIQIRTSGIYNVFVTNSDYTNAAAFKAAMSGVMLYYELATPVETAISPPLQALPTFKDFTSFSAPNSLTQNGPLSVTYYAEGGASPEKGWLTSYKRKLYMGRNIEWNQLFTNSKTSSNGVTISQNQDGTMTLNGTPTKTYINFDNLSDAMNQAHKYLLCLKILNNLDNVWFYYGWLNRSKMNTDSIRNGESCRVCDQSESLTQLGVNTGLGFTSGTVFNNVKIAVMVMDLTQMFGAGNEPATPEEFWSYFDHKLYPYNPGETQPLFKISRKSRMGAKHYTARWDKVNAKMVRLNDAASFPTDTSNFGNFGSVNPDYDNPFDSIYPWSGIRICNIDLDAYMALQPGDSITKCVKAWEGDPDFDWNDDNGVWRYRPEFWGSSWDDGTYRYFDVTDRPAGGYVHYPEAIAGRWHGCALTRTVNGSPIACLIPKYLGMPAVRTALSTLHTYAKNYGATLDSIYSIDADLLLLTVEYATMNSQSAIGNGVTDLYRQGGYQIAAAATDSNVIKVLAADAGDYFINAAILDVGTTDGGNEVGRVQVISAEPDTDPTYLNVTINRRITVTRDNYWSIHGLSNINTSIGAKSGYIGTNGRTIAFYRGMELYGNMWFYTLGAYENAADNHIWIAADAGQADAYDALDTSVHIDTGLVLPTSAGYIQTLGLPQRSGLLALPPFCTAVGGSSTNPVGDYFYNGDYTYNTVLLRGGYASIGSYAGALYGIWSYAASYSNWNCSARPRLKNP